MENDGLLKNGVATRLSSSQVARCTNGGDCSSQPNSWYGETSLDPHSIDWAFGYSKCVICRIPWGGTGEHWLAEYPEVKKRGLEITYNIAKDKRKETQERVPATISQPDWSQCPPAANSTTSQPGSNRHTTRQATEQASLTTVAPSATNLEAAKCKQADA